MRIVFGLIICFLFSTQLSNAQVEFGVGFKGVKFNSDDYNKYWYGVNLFSSLPIHERFNFRADIHYNLPQNEEIRLTGYPYSPTLYDTIDDFKGKQNDKLLSLRTGLQCYLSGSFEDEANFYIISLLDLSFQRTSLSEDGDPRYSDNTYLLEIGNDNESFKRRSLNVEIGLGFERLLRNDFIYVELYSFIPITELKSTSFNADLPVGFGIKLGFRSAFNMF